MKKCLYASVLLSIMMVFGAASVWEGAAAAAGSGSLPDSGYYAATNSFPKNTIVDVENLETGKTVRVIVVDALDSPGLLAVLSREAAEAIGLRNRTMGRIRMTMPADPIAFSRFTEGLGSSGDPDRDPEAALASSAQIIESLNVKTAEPEEVVVELEQEELIASDIDEETSDLPETTLAKTEDDIIDVPESFMPPPITEDPDITLLSDTVPVTSPELFAEPEDNFLVEAEAAVDEPEETLMVKSEEGPEISLEASAPEDDDVHLEEAEQVSIVQIEVDDEELLPEALADIPLTTPEEDDIILSLIPAEERPPELSTVPELPPDSEVPLIADAPEVQEEDQFVEPEIVAEEAFVFIPPIEDESGEIEEPSIAATNPVEQIRIPEQGTVVFSAPFIEKLESDKYYLQLGAFTKAELVEPAISKLDKNYPVYIQRSQSGNRQVYRILVGPVNLGESAALLQRFKRSGYQDAFIRQES